MGNEPDSFMKKRVRQIFILLFTWVLLLPLPGCWWLFMLPGNGGGYPGMEDDGYGGGVAPPAAPSIQGTTYYWFKPGYTCVKDGVAIQTHRDAIFVGEDGTFVRKGDGCSTAPVATGQASELEIEAGLLGYQGGIYQKR